MGAARTGCGCGCGCGCGACDCSGTASSAATAALSTASGLCSGSGAAFILAAGVLVVFVFALGFGVVPPGADCNWNLDVEEIKFRGGPAAFREFLKDRGLFYGSAGELGRRLRELCGSAEMAPRKRGARTRSETLAAGSDSVQLDMYAPPKKEGKKYSKFT